MRDTREEVRDEVRDKVRDEVRDKGEDVKGYRRTHSRRGEE